MPAFLKRTKQRISENLSRLETWIDEIRGSSTLVKADFEIGGKTMHSYLRTHRNKFHRNVGAHFLMNLYEAGPEVLSNFAEKHREFGWHFPMTSREQEALRTARDVTCAHSHISGLRYSTNIFNVLANKKQLLRMLGLGLVAGSAGILLGLGELFFFAKEYSKDLLSNVLGIEWQEAPPEAGDEFVTLAKEITDGAVNSDGTLDSEVVASRIADLVEGMENAANADTAVKYMTADTTYIVGIISGILLLVIGRGMVQLILEGVTQTVTKVDALVEDMDNFCEFKLGRSPFPPTQRDLPGDFIVLPPATILPPKDVPLDFRMRD
jgi:hypothetical protein